jgi:hypothetical protein
MIRYVGLIVFRCFAAYGFANGIFALRNPYGWLRAKWTARRGYDAGDDPPPSIGDIRGMGLFFLFTAFVAAWIATKVTLRILRTSS